MEGILVIILAYIIGSIPFAYIVTRAMCGVDIRYFGDGNVGTRNAWRAAGPLAGITVLLADVGKGYTAITLARLWGLSELAVLIAGFAVVLGHDWPLFLHFRGGQGQAAIIGVLLALLPRETIIGLAVGLALWALTRHLDFSMSIGLGLIPLQAWWYGRPLRLVLYPVALLPTIGIKKLIDLPRARALRARRERDPLGDEMADESTGLRRRA